MIFFSFMPHVSQTKVEHPPQSVVKNSTRVCMEELLPEGPLIFGPCRSES